MAKRVVLWLAVLVGLTVAVILAVPASRYTALGLLNREPFYENRPFRFWRHALKDHNPRVRKDAAFALGAMSEAGDKAVPDLGRALSDDETLVRLNAALALFKIGPPARAAVPELSAALKDPDIAVRMDAALALARIGPDAGDAVPALTEALDDPANRASLRYFSRSIREQVACTLGKIGPPARAARPALAAALDDGDDNMRVAAAEAIHRIEPDDPGPVPVRPDAGEATGGR